MDINSPEAKEWSDHMRRLSEQEAEIERLTRAFRLSDACRVSAEQECECLRAALKPFADFADDARRYPKDTPITSGSRMAKRQLTMWEIATELKMQSLMSS